MFYGIFKLSMTVFEDTMCINYTIFNLFGSLLGSSFKAYKINIVRSDIELFSLDFIILNTFDLHVSNIYHSCY